jgi:uncharacterized protein YbbK (DUF523 family)
MNNESDLRRPIRIGVSACLLGASVRFDGGHKRDQFLTETFGLIRGVGPVCPEVECGLGTRGKRCAWSAWTMTCGCSRSGPPSI